MIEAVVVPKTKGLFSQLTDLLQKTEDSSQINDDIARETLDLIAVISSLDPQIKEPMLNDALILRDRIRRFQIHTGKLR